MLKLIFLIFIFFHLNLHARTSNALERINFYPNAKGYLKAEYSYQILQIDTPQVTVKSKEVRDFNNLFALTYAHKFKYFFLGVKSVYEVASESAVKYGVPVSNRYHSQGFKEPELFLLTRLRTQNEEHANIDLFVSFIDSLGDREVGQSEADRLYGGNILTAKISHGMKDEGWEFSNSLQYILFYNGVEDNKFTEKKYDLGSYSMFTYLFMGQYDFGSSSFINAGVGIDYRSVLEISDQQGDKKELQDGTGSVFRIGYKRSISDWTLVEFRYEFRRNNYFVKADDNFDGQQTQHSFNLSLTQAF